MKIVILLIIDQGETYGYALQQQLVQNGFGNIPQGTIYPLLLKLQHQELIKAHKKSSSTGPDRNIIKLHQRSSTYYNFLPQWQQALSKLMGNKGES
ncbi:helix-turn-helix transcriptional regulator [Lactobacillus sp. W8089]|nr:helix-turn-helix transcriptional regulator [Lactobacillus sp. W8086]MBI0108667.1 helix-turn-helix transcriptional regulator [Lactobacillus sp. W8085]MBI0111884.1 helix-turn-helix transcriptional regulator [Lactobacillus sp. W8088]MBI0115600.1 helix-turn-helix transcriptional regulator [Lactobacillus sp. W8087]MBI0119324.1 helix-turn-helix transcriptional regulator [Lactobacillus sp. W8089]MBI0131290.1 helix-turn-helix transcriptional regulator [Lactobacillus sp. W8090]